MIKETSTEAGGSPPEQPLEEGIGCLHTLKGKKSSDTPPRKRGGKKARMALPKKTARSSHTSVSAPSASAAGGESPGSVEVVEAEAEYEIVRATGRLRIWLPDSEDDRTKLLAALWSAQQMVATGKNLLLRWYWRADAAVLDQSLLTTGAAPKPWPKAEPPGGTTGGYQMIRRALPQLGSGIAAAVAREVREKWQRERWETLVRQTRSPPHWKNDGPIPVRKQEAKFSHVAGQEYQLRVTLHSGESNHASAAALKIVAKTTYERKLLGSLVDGTVRQRSVAIAYHRRKRRWYVRINYSQRVLKKTEGSVAAIHRGMRFFLVGLTDRGDEWIYDGADIAATLRRFQRRRQRRQRQAKTSAREGRGRKRVLSAIDHLEQRGERWRKTRCQTIARRFVEWLVKRGVATLFVEDFTGIRDAREAVLRVKGKKAKAAVWERVQEWPYYLLEQCIVACAHEAGLTVGKVSARWISTTWPDTGEPAEPDLSRWVMVGPRGKTIHLDRGAAQNVLRRASAEMTSDAAKSEIEWLRPAKKSNHKTARKGGDKDPKSGGSGSKGRNR
jgi:hypothetical protein